MKTIFGLDLGTTSIGWAVVSESDNAKEQSEIKDLGVRLVPLSTEDTDSFTKKDKETMQGKRTAKRSMRRNLQRYKLRRDTLIKVLRNAGFINDDSALCEDGPATTFQTLRLRADAATRKISLEELARVLLAINKKRGYKSNRKYKNEDEGAAIDSMDVAIRLYDDGITPAQLSLQLLDEGRKKLPDYYRSDLRNDFDRIWDFQKQFYPQLLTDEIKEQISDKKSTVIWAILDSNWKWETSVAGITQVQTLAKQPKRTTDRKDLKRENLQWRADALTRQMQPVQLAYIFQDINAEISRSSGYLGCISDRSKILRLRDITVGQYMMEQIDDNPHTSLKNQVFYRQDYMDEFDRIWETQSQFHPQLTPELKHELRDIIIFYQRRLKSKKNLINNCQLIEITVSDKQANKTLIVGPKVAPRSSPLFQTFKIWQTINDIIVTFPDDTSRPLELSEKKMLANELTVKNKLTANQVLTMLFGKKTKGYAINFGKEIQGDITGNDLYKAYSDILEELGYDPIDFEAPAAHIRSMVSQIFASHGISTDILTFDPLADKPEQQPYYQLWQLLYSFEDDAMTGIDKLVDKLAERYCLDRQCARILARTTFIDDYASISAKAIKMLLPFMTDGMAYSDACQAAGLNHSKASITAEQNQQRPLLEQLPQVAKNSLRNPVVEKILNQMVNVINALIEQYGNPDEIRVELARELKKNKAQRIEMTKAVEDGNKENERIRKLLKSKGISAVGRNDIIRWKLYEELAPNGYKSLYSDKKISEDQVIHGKDIEIEHIIPQALLFDDSISNKTLEFSDVNGKKGKTTAIDFVLEEYGQEGLTRYINTVNEIFKDKPAKRKKLLMHRDEIPTGFIDRDIRATQYISRKALEMLSQVSRSVIATSGTITSRLREDWQLIDVMKEINYDKYAALGMTEIVTKGDKRIVKINDWSKRNDHRHHALDALTVAFTKRAIIQCLNTLSAADDSEESLNAQQLKEKYISQRKVVPPMPVNVLRAQAKQHLDNILISIKAKNKAVTKNKRANDMLTPRGALHLETVYGKRVIKSYEPCKVDSSFDAATIATVADKRQRAALMRRLEQFGGDPKKAFTGKNSLAKNPVWIDDEHTICVPDKVDVVKYNTVYTIRKSVAPKLNVDKVLDPVIRDILRKRLDEYGGNDAKAFVNLDENPIWFDREHGIAIKTVTIDASLNNPIAIHSKHDHHGNKITHEDGTPIAADFVDSGSNHHVALFIAPALDRSGNVKRDDDGNVVECIEEHIVPFFEAVERANQGLPIVDKNYNSHLGWKYLMTLQQNQYVVFPDIEHGFNPAEIDLTDPKNRDIISPHMFRVQALSSRYYTFRLHIDTSAVYDNRLRDYTWKRIRMPELLRDVIKVRLNQLGQIVAVGE